MSAVDYRVLLSLLRNVGPKVAIIANVYIFLQILGAVCSIFHSAALAVVPIEKSQPFKLISVGRLLTIFKMRESLIFPFKTTMSFVAVDQKLEANFMVFSTIPFF